MFPSLSLIFLKRSLVFPILLFSSIYLHWSLKKALLSLLAILWTLHSNGYIFLLSFAFGFYFYFIKTSVSVLLTMPKPFTVWITTNCGKFLKRWEYQTTWPASWEICQGVTVITRHGTNTSKQDTEEESLPGKPQIKKKTFGLKGTMSLTGKIMIKSCQD